MSDIIMDHCNGSVSWDHYVHVQPTVSMRAEEKDGTEEENMELTLIWFMIDDHLFPVAFRGEEKDRTEMQERGKKKEGKKALGRCPVCPTIMIVCSPAKHNGSVVGFGRVRANQWRQVKACYVNCHMTSNNYV